MEIDLGPEYAAFRAEIRGWIERTRPTGCASSRTGAGRCSPAAAAAARLAAATADPPLPRVDRAARRRAAPVRPVADRGRRARVGRRALRGVQRGAAPTRACPTVRRGMGETLVGPAIIAHGTDAQRAYFLPRIVSGEDVYCQGYSEPDHGSDLAAVETRGRRRRRRAGDHRAEVLDLRARTTPT